MSLDALFSDHYELPAGGLQVDWKNLPAHGGVYAFTDEHGRPVQIAGGQNLRRAVSFRLSPPKEDSKRADLRAVTRRVWWQPTYSQFETALTYYNIIRQLEPARYRKLLAFGPVWFATARVEDRLPRWVVSDTALSPVAVEIGPFAAKKLCVEYVELLEDLFNLCRYDHVLQQAPDGEACAYFEMGRCPAPCDGSISLDEYRRQVRASADFATGADGGHLRRMREEMESASGALDFERAARARDALERAEKTLTRCKRITRTPQDFRCLVIQRAGGRTKVKPFFVDRGVIEPGQVVLIKKLDEHVGGWVERMQPAGCVPIDDPVACSERIWLVCHFLNKGDNTPGMYVMADDSLDAGTLADRIREKFAVKRQSPATDRAGGAGLVDLKGWDNKL